jgi:hypothetical protein
MEDSLPKRIEKNINLNDHCIQEESVDQRGPSVPSYERHEETETYQNHYVHVLEGTVALTLQRVSVGMGVHPYKYAINDNDGNFQQKQNNSEGT